MLPVVLRDILSLPTAAFVEDAVADFVRAFCKKLPGVRLKADRWGNLLTHYRRGRARGTPLVFSAHMDHPGFAALKMTGEKQLRAAFRGWVEPEFFVGTGVRFWDGNAWVRGRVRRITKVAKVYRMIGRTARPEEVEIEIARAVPAGAPGMWDLPDPALKGGLVSARGCDDLAGCAAMLTLLERLSRSKASGAVYCLFTRAEEVGFVGALGAVQAGTVPKRLPVISIETSKALPNAPIGEGPVLRVGDKSSIFTPELTAYCERVAAKLKDRKPKFRYQRKLMDGGTCEATAFYAYGYAATGICVPLGNYHNMNTEHKRIDSEKISLSDWENMVDWFEALVRDEQGYRPGPSAPLRKNLDQRFAQWGKLL